MDDLQFQVEELAFQLEQQSRRHVDAVAKLNEEARDLKRRLLTLLEPQEVKKKELPDCAFLRSVEWRLEHVSEVARNHPKDKSIYSPEFSILGVSGLQLEFFPNGRESTVMEGFCSLFLWCPAGVTIKYQFRIGSHCAGPDEDVYTSRMGHGHSNFCLFEAQVDARTDSVVIGIDVLSLTMCDDSTSGLRLITQAPEMLISQKAELLRNRHMDCVEWRIKRIRKRAAEVPAGLSICSRPFSIAGVPEILLEFYPNGIKTGNADVKECYCGFYFRCPAGTVLTVTLFVGKHQKGPNRTEFDNNTAKGLPEFCLLQDQITDEDDIVVGLKVTNPQLEDDEAKVVLNLTT